MEKSSEAKQSRIELGWEEHFPSSYLFDVGAISMAEEALKKIRDRRNGRPKESNEAPDTSSGER